MSAPKRLNQCGPQVVKSRHIHQWTQTELAARLSKQGWKASRDMVAALETQRRAVSDQELMLLSRVLRVTPSLLLAFESECIKICPYQAENERLLTQLRRLKLLPAE